MFGHLPDRERSLCARYLIHAGIGRRAPTSRVVMRGNCGEAFNGFCSCQTTHVCLPGTTTGPYGCDARWQSTVAEQKAHNTQLTNFGAYRNHVCQVSHGPRSNLALPDLMLAALQVNIAGGRLPTPEADSRRYLKVPASMLFGECATAKFCAAVSPPSEKPSAIRSRRSNSPLIPAQAGIEGRGGELGPRFRGDERSE